MSDFVFPEDSEVDHPLLGQRVRVRIDEAATHVIEGRLLKLTRDGSVDVLQDDGRTSFAWPALEISPSEIPD